MSTDFGIMTLMLPICVLIGGWFMLSKSAEPVAPPRCGDEYRALIALVSVGIELEGIVVGEESIQPCEGWIRVTEEVEVGDEGWSFVRMKRSQMLKYCVSVSRGWSRVASNKSLEDVEVDAVKLMSVTDEGDGTIPK